VKYIVIALIVAVICVFPASSSSPGSKAFFFKDNQYIRYDWDRDRTDPGYPRYIRDDWQGWPPGFTPIDAALLGEGPFKNKAYFFRGDQYIRFDLIQGRIEPGYPKPIAGHWGGFPYDFTQGIDTAVSGSGPFKGKIYFFKGDRYIKYDWERDKIDPGYPKPIAGHWNGWPSDFTNGITAALSGGGQFKGKAYFFKGDRYIRYDWKNDKTDPGYPKPITGHWEGFPNSFTEGIDTALPGDIY
jgi:hypothetical protein